MRFIGSKEQLNHFFEEAFTNHLGSKINTVGDPFCGTGAVSRFFKKRGYRVVAGDNLKFCSILTKAILNISDEPKFEKVSKSGQINGEEIQNLFSTVYDQVLHYLNHLDGEEGFIYRAYSPEGSSKGEHQRMYFSNENAKKIDAIRLKIREWNSSELINQDETDLLLSDLILASNRVSNIAGTYGAFLKHWEPRAKRDLILTRSVITPSDSQHEVYCGDAFDLVNKNSFDVLYFDPPYTWRHYGAYYHILETIAVGDEPTISGKTGLRDWQESKSRFSNKVDAVVAMKELVTLSKCKHLFISYNSEGLITHEQMIEILEARGEPTFYETAYRRYRSNNGEMKNNKLFERLYYVKII